ncbi:hypothetical protein QWA68_012001 [Fusarium oxysporum]|nr:hypothetical protein QWA68_012001 [Fusarium oxysporum]
MLLYTNNTKLYLTVIEDDCKTCLALGVHFGYETMQPSLSPKPRFLKIRCDLSELFNDFRETWFISYSMMIR